MKTMPRALRAMLALLLCAALCALPAMAEVAAEVTDIATPPPLLNTDDSDAAPDPGAGSEASPEPASTAEPAASDEPAPELTSAPSAEPAPEPSASLRFENGDIAIGRGERVRDALRPVIEGEAPGELRYSSSNPKVVRVDAASGELYGVKAGSATISAELPGGISANCSVTVHKAPSKLRLTLDADALGAGESAELQISFNSGAYSWARNLRSSDESIVRLEGERLVAVAPGSATISGKTYNGKKASLRLTVREAPTALRFADMPDSLGAGEALPLAASVNDGAAGAIRYALDSGAEFASLEGSLLTALAPGEITVRAEAYNGIAATRSFAILPAPEAVTLAEAELTLGLGERRADALHASLSEGSAGGLRFVSDRPGVVKVDAQTGALTAKKRGTAHIRAVAFNGVESAPCQITVRPAPKKIKLQLSMKNCSVGQEQIAEVKTLGGEGQWTLSCDNPSAIEIRDSNRLVAVGIGKAKITAKSYNGKKSSASVNVVAAPESVLPDREQIELVLGLPERVGFSAPNSYATFRYESSNPEIAAIAPDGDGTVTPLRTGEAVITATSHNGISASTRVRVCPLAEELAVDEAEITLCVGERTPFAFRALPEGALARYSYVSSARGIAAVDESGQISGMKPGSAVISVNGHNGISARVTVHVIDYAARHETAAIAHRGASAYYRENTLDAFRCAAELGAEWIETDVRLTADDQIVLYHDKTIRVGKKAKSSSSLTLAELQAIDPRIVTLDEGLDCIKELPIRLLIEFKSAGPELERRVIEAVQARGMMERTAFDSFDWDCMERLKANYPEAKAVLVVSTQKQLKQIIQQPDIRGPIDGVTVRHTLLTADNVRDLHLRGLDVTCWTATTRKSIQRLKQIGVDGIMCNYPDWV